MCHDLKEVIQTVFVMSTRWRSRLGEVQPARIGLMLYWSLTGLRIHNGDQEAEYHRSVIFRPGLFAECPYTVLRLSSLEHVY